MEEVYGIIKQVIFVKEVRLMLIIIIIFMMFLNLFIFFLSF